MENSMKDMSLKDEKKTNLSEVEQKILKSIEKNNLEEFTKLLEENPKLDVNFIDDDKMTPLQQAAYRGNTEIVKLLLNRGADVNKCEHENDYTSLHFGALSGNVDVCHLLLAAGVKIHALNSINRTAAQLASFVGYHNIVSTINNFIPRADIEYYTKLQGQQTVPYLPPELCESFYKFSLLYNLHPIKIAMLVQSYKGLIDNIDAVRKVFELLSEKEMKRKDSNEVLSFKFYYISYILGEISKVIKARRESNASEEKTFIEVFSKKLLKTNKDGNLEMMDAFLRESVREFPYIDSTLFRQMVASLAGDNSPSALSIISAAINGQRAFLEDTIKCETCGEDKPTKKCAKCKEVSYCDRECQRLHWFMHKKTCARSGAETAKNVDSREISADLQGLLARN